MYLPSTLHIGDYDIGSTLLKESASAIYLCDASPSAPVVPHTPPSSAHHHHLHPNLPLLAKYLPENRSRTPSPEPTLTSFTSPPPPRRIVILVLGIKPHRKLWTTSARPGESVINYLLLNGCPAIVLPAKPGAPLVAWDGLTLKQLHELELPNNDGGWGGEKFKGVIGVLMEYIDLCVDWDRVVLEGGEGEGQGEGGLMNSLDGKKSAARSALSLLLVAAVCSKDSTEVKKEVDPERAGIVMFRIP